jgi:hypothetical protein
MAKVQGLALVLVLVRVLAKVQVQVQVQGLALALAPVLVLVLVLVLVVVVVPVLVLVVVPVPVLAQLQREQVPARQRAPVLGRRCHRRKRPAPRRPSWRPSGTGAVVLTRCGWGQKRHWQLVDSWCDGLRWADNKQKVCVC